MKLQFTVLTCALLLSACADQAARARLGIQDPAVLQTGFGAAQDAAAGAPDREWLDTFGPLTNRGSALASLQQRLDGITGDGYFHAKAHCWIAAGRQEFDARDQWGFVEETIGAAAVLTTSLERGAAISAARPPMRTLVTVRPDLWGIVEVVRRDPAFAACQAAQAPLACAEVELMHAGHDAWRRSFDAAEARVRRTCCERRRKRRSNARRRELERRHRWRARVYRTLPPPPLRHAVRTRRLSQTRLARLAFQDDG
ncbi:hypothetical protein [Paraburkholderia sp. GAS334]|uniref:hypothetical protein n=1 Tax=Paraburkholderia sp. GAS334 TaxID=3035131 RepID=UPI003D263366